MLPTEIKKWLSNPKRSYQEGLSVFNKYASESARRQFGEYLNNVPDKERVHQFDPHFSILINQITFVERRIRSNKDLFIEAVKEESKKSTKSQAKKEPAKSEEAVKGTAEYAEIKEIVPKMAKLHAMMADEKIADDLRKTYLDELVSLDDRRRFLWSILDKSDADFEKEEDEKEVEKSMFELGVQLNKEIKRLRENIARSRTNLKKYAEQKNKTKVASCNEKIERYQAELDAKLAMLHE